MPAVFSFAGRLAAMAELLGDVVKVAKPSSSWSASDEFGAAA